MKFVLYSSRGIRPVNSCKGYPNKLFQPEPGPSSASENTQKTPDDSADKAANKEIESVPDVLKIGPSSAGK